MGRRLSGMPFAASALLVAGALGACQSEESPPGSLSPSAASTSAAPSASASATPSASSSSDIPAAAREKSDKGAEAFVRYFFDQVNTAWTTPRAGLITTLSDPECDFCVKTEDTAAFLVKEGQKYQSDPVTLKTIEPLSGAPDHQTYLYCELTQNRSSIIKSNGHVVTTDPRKEAYFNVAVKWTRKGWVILGVENAR